MGIRISSKQQIIIPAILGLLMIFLLSTVTYSQDFLKEMRSNVIEKINGKEILIDLGNIHEINKGIYILSLRSKGGYMNKKIALF